MTTTTSTSRRSSSSEYRVVVRCSTRSDGDFHLTNQSRDAIEATRRRFIDLPWTMADECHGLGVIRVTEPGGGDRAVGDIVITELDDVVLGCWVGDCAPIVLIGAGREFAVVHAGWRGLAQGVVDTAVAAFSEPVIRAQVGPTIGACCYEFGADDLAAVAAGVHTAPAAVTAVTSTGLTALDVSAAVRAACRHHDIDVELLAGCTGCTYDGFSHRVRGDAERHVVAACRTSEVAA